MNADGDMVVSYVEERRIAECCEPPHSSRPRSGPLGSFRRSTAFSEGPFQASQPDETDAVTDHDPAIADNGDATILFAADPDRPADRLFARRWLASQARSRASPTRDPSSSRARPRTRPT